MTASTDKQAETDGPAAKSSSINDRPPTNDSLVMANLPDWLPG
jgi:hypothetical protein